MYQAKDYEAAEELELKWRQTLLTQPKVELTIARINSSLPYEPNKRLESLKKFLEVAIKVISLLLLTMQICRSLIEESNLAHRVGLGGSVFVLSL